MPEFLASVRSRKAIMPPFGGPAVLLVLAVIAGSATPAAPPEADVKAEAGAGISTLEALKAALTRRDFSGWTPSRVVLVPNAVSVMIKDGAGTRRVVLAGLKDPQAEKPGALGSVLSRRDRDFPKGLVAGRDVYIERSPGPASDTGENDPVHLYRLEMLGRGYGFLDE
jgi:hypothetical protein